MWMNQRLQCGLVFLAVSISLLTRAAHAGPGAIFTTDENGTIVNGNNYDDCCDVYLNGGPPPNAPCTSAGLPDGEYYFQVTNPSGSVLLSTDDIEQRRFRVEDGLIVEYLGTATGDCNHELGDGKCTDAFPENISIQLMPFNQTPNEGGVYKAHVTLVADYDPGNPNSNFGFVPSDTKTDNFKCEHVEPPPPPPPPHDCKLIIKKYKDRNGNGQNDGEQALDGFSFNVCWTPDGGTETCVVVTTGDHGPGEAKADVPGGIDITVCELEAGSLDGCVWKQTEPNEYSDNAEFIDGQWCYVVQCTPEEEVIYVEFGNLCIEEMDYAKSVEYWTKTSGKNTLKSNDPTWRTQLNASDLRNDDGQQYLMAEGGTSFNSAYKSLRSWMKNADDQNMAYQLSVQLAATKFNIKYKGLNKKAKVLLQPEQADALGLNNHAVSIKTIMKWADDSLEDHAMTDESSPERNYQQSLAEVLDDINRNRLSRVIAGASSVVYD